MSPPEIPAAAAPAELEPLGVSPIGRAIEATLETFRKLGHEAPPALEALARRTRPRE